MSGLLNTLHELHQQHKERHEARHGGGHHNDYGVHDNHTSQHQNQRPYQGNDDDDARRPQSYQPQGQGQGHSYAPPHGPPPSARGPSGFGAHGGLDRGDYATDAEIERLGSQLHGQRLNEDDDEDDDPRRGQGRGYVPPSGPPPAARAPPGFTARGDLDRGDFASDADIDRMIASGEFDQRQTHGREEYGYGRGNLERQNALGRHDAPTRLPHQEYGEPTGEYGRYDAPSGPPPGRGYQGQQYSQQDYGSGYGGPDRSNQHGPPYTQGRTQFDLPQERPSGYGRGQDNAPAGGFVSSRDGKERYDSGYGGPTDQDSEPPRRGEAASYYDEQSQGDRPTRLAGLAQERGDDDPERYRRATQGLHEKTQVQAKSRPQNRDDEDDDYKAHVDAHRKAYGNDDHGPMDANAIGLAAAMEAFKQTAAAAKSLNAPAGALKAGKASEDTSSKPGRVAQEEEGETAAERGRAAGGLQDKLVSLAMAQAGKLFDKKNVGSGGDKSQDKAQAMQSAAATAMQLFAKYKTKGSLDSSDMSTVMGLAMKLM